MIVHAKIVLSPYILFVKMFSVPPVYLRLKGLFVNFEPICRTSMNTFAFRRKYSYISFGEQTNLTV